MCERLETKLLHYAGSDAYPLHMPGHKRNPAFLCADALTDITEISDFDNLHHPEGILRDEMDLAKRLYGTKETFFSVNGSTGALLAAISAAVPRGGRMLIERGCHMAVYHAAYLREAKIFFLGESEPESVDALVVTSPTYEGCMKDIPAMRTQADKFGAALIVDEAHGAHLPFAEKFGFPASAIRGGADLVIQSIHKTMPAMTQTALLHNVTGRIKNEDIARFLDIYETSSPSYVLMGSITHVLHMMEDRGEALMGAYAERIRNVRAFLSTSLHNLALAGGETAVLTEDTELLPYRKGTVMDPGKLVIRSGRMRGERLFAILRDNYGLECEMKAPGYVLAMTSVADTDEGLMRLVTALREIDENYDFFAGDERGPEALPVYESGDKAGNGGAVDIAAALDGPKERVPLRGAAGRRAAGFVVLYPPDVPVAVPGELFTHEKLIHIFRWMDCGYDVMGVENGMVCVEKKEENS